MPGRLLAAIKASCIAGLASAGGPASHIAIPPNAGVQSKRLFEADFGRGGAEVACRPDR